MTNEYERRMRVLRGFRGSYAKVIVSLKVNYSGATFSEREMMLGLSRF